MNRYLIWSIEHAAWWRPEWMGYTHVLSEAGRYSFAESQRILDQANVAATNECMIPEEYVIGEDPRLAV